MRKKLFATMMALVMMTGCASASTSSVDDTVVVSNFTETNAITSVENTDVVSETLIGESSSYISETSVETTATTTETSVTTVEPIVATTVAPIETTIATVGSTVETSAPETSSTESTTTISKDYSENVTTIVTEALTTISEFVSDVEKPTRVVLPVENIQQLPELPAGCEVTATTIVMNYEGIKVDKMTLMTYLPMMQYPDENGLWESPWNKFVGNPKLSYYGCYSPVIIETVESCLETNDIKGYEVVDLRDSSMEDLYAQIDDGHPVIVWATMSMVASRNGNSWYLQDGSKYTWRANEHCLVLIGYDTENNTVILSDPYDKRGTVEYDADLFETRYTELYKQALVIKRTDK